MAPTFDAVDFWKDPNFSDITITFSGRRMPCHKIILYANSAFFKFFKESCNPGSLFKENSQKEIELIGDNDPDAVEAVLEYIYTRKFKHVKGTYDWRFLLEVNRVADKYLVPDLQSLTYIICRDAMRTLSDTTEALGVIDIIRSSDWPRFFGLADALEKRLRCALLKIPEYRSRVELDKDTMWTIIDQFNHGGDLVCMLVFKCRDCKRIKIREEMANASSLDSFPCPQQGCRGRLVSLGSCWIPKGIASQT